MLNVFFLGLISFFTDISTEMVYPLIPLYLASTFGATPALIGVIEGIAESLASLLKVFSGYISDRFQKKKMLALAGYSTAVFYKLVLIIAGSWIGIFGARVLDRFGKGIRSSPRDALVSESADKKALGKAFGLHKALDMAGAAIGILITYGLLTGFFGDFEYKDIFAISIVPAVIGLCMFLFVKEKKIAQLEREREAARLETEGGVGTGNGAEAKGRIAQTEIEAESETVDSRVDTELSGAKQGAGIAPAKPKRIALWKSFKGLNGQLKLYLLVVALFTLGNSSNAFLLLKASAVGFNEVSVVLLYFVYYIAAAVLSLPFGRLSDRVGRKRVLVMGYAVFAIAYLGFAVAFSQPFLVGMFALYGVHTAMVTGVERAFVAEIAPPELKGTMLGLQATIAGIALLPASIITGVLWNLFGSVVPFVFGAALSLLATLNLAIFMHGRNTEQPVAAKSL
ncbi:MAG: MFS transporter [Coriobacteriia bacterium]|nr:MFS transporter [Coriobacteriia bacterium]